MAGLPRPICYSKNRETNLWQTRRDPKVAPFLLGRVWGGVDAALAAFSHVQAAWRMGRTRIHGASRLARLQRLQALGRLLPLRRRHRTRRPTPPRPGQGLLRPQRRRIPLPPPARRFRKRALSPQRPRPVRSLHPPRRSLVPHPRRHGPPPQTQNVAHCISRRPSPPPRPPHPRSRLRTLPRSLGITLKKQNRTGKQASLIPGGAYWGPRPGRVLATGWGF